MRDLIRPELIKPTLCAALASAVLCLPRLLLWSNRIYPIWYLEAIIFTGGFVLWAFVFAWHTKYSGRPVFTLKIPPADFIAVTVTGIVTAIALACLLDPVSRPALPEDYPTDWKSWLARCLFTLGLDQLFIVFAPYAWLIRLFRSRRMALAFTVLFSLVVLLLKVRMAHAPIGSALFAILVISRILGTAASVIVYLRGGLVLAWWWGFLLQVHYLPF